MSNTTGFSSSLRAFADVHGPTRAVLQPIGEAGVRVTLVGADGVLGDRVVADMAAAQALVAECGWVTDAGGWERDLVAAASPRAGHWRKMAGWVAHQRRFPKARNASSV